MDIILRPDNRVRGAAEVSDFNVTGCIHSISFHFQLLSTIEVTFYLYINYCICIPEKLPSWLLIIPCGWTRLKFCNLVSFGC